MVLDALAEVDTFDGLPSLEQGYLFYPEDDEDDGDDG
jgi:hypothetical protein